MSDLQNMKKEFDDYLDSKSKEEIVKELTDIGFEFGDSFKPKPNSFWLVVVECRYNVVAVDHAGDGFYIPGQEPCWDLSHVDKWVKEIEVPV